MKRVCMIVLSLYPNDVRVRREAEALEEKGIAVDVICLRDHRQPAFEQLGQVRAFRILRQKDKEQLLQYIGVSLVFTLAAFLKLQQLSLKNNYDLVQVHNMPDYLVFAALVQKLRGKPVVLDLHDLSVELFQSKWGEHRWKLLPMLVRWVERMSCSFSDHLITTSTGFRDRLVQRGVPAEKVTLVLNAPDPRIFTFQPDRRFVPITCAARLLYHGTVAKRFGLAVAIDALALLQKQIPDSKLYIYGKYDPSYRKSLEEQIQRLSLQNHVLLYDHRSLEEIREIVQQSDIAVVPYLKDDFMNLANSTKTFECAASGLPIVASRLFSISSIFDEGCLSYANPGDAQDLADKIAQLCLEPQRRKQQALRAKEALKEISYSVMVERYYHLIRDLMDQRPPAPRTTD